ncbi:MAG TPA: AMP-binding protein [Gemmatimonadaceae bacterium]|nr:AMP-binding protein [Gemmatimonadaceae bacterium]
MSMLDARDRSWSWIVRHGILPIGDRLFGQRMMQRLALLERAQWWPPERVHAQRDAAVRALLRTAYDEVPFYRRIMRDAGVTPADITGAPDLARLPIVTKDMMRAAYPHDMARRTRFRPYEVSSSGSTGANFVVLEDSETAGWWRASLLLAFEWAGWRIGEPHMQTGIMLRRTDGRALKDHLLRCHYVSAYDLTDAHLDAALAALERHRLMHLRGYPGILYHLARRAIETGWNRPLRSVATWGDTLFAHYRETIERAFGTRVFDLYGIGEGMQIAAQCGSGQRYHVHALDVVVDVVDDAGEPVRPGVPGHLILTRLHPGPMPLIRYRVGDIGIVRDTPCACGRGFDVLESVQGRDTDIVLTPSGNRLIVHFFTGVLASFTEISAYQVVQTEADAIAVRVVPAQSFGPETRDRIVARLREKGATELRIDVEPVREIPVAPSGKRRFVISDYARRHYAAAQRAPSRAASHHSSTPTGR